MRRKSFQLLFWLCLSVVLGVMGWLSVSLWNLENRRAGELSRNRLEELTRLALWRMDSVLASYWLEENGRAPQEYFFLTEKNSEKRSPLFSLTPGYARLYFQINSEGHISSPQIPEEQGNGSKNKKDPSDSLHRDFHLLTRSSIASLLGKTPVGEAPAGATKNGDAFPVDSETLPEQGMPPASPGSASLSNGKVEQTSDALASNGKKQEQKQEGKSALEMPSGNLPVQKNQFAPVPSVKRQQTLDLAQRAQSEIDYGIRAKFNKALNQNLSQNNSALHQELPSANSPFGDKDSWQEETGIADAARRGRLETADSWGKDLQSSRAKPRMNLSKEKASNPKRKKEIAPLAINDLKKSSSDKPLEEKMRQMADTGKIAPAPSAIAGMLLEQEFESNGMELKEKAHPSMTIAEMPLSVSPFSPRWVDGQLFLLRTVSNANQKYIQGIWLDWEKVRKILLSSISDFLPDADLTPLPGGEVTQDNVARALTGLPLLIEPGHLPPQIVSEMRPMREALIVACAFALAAAAVAAFLLRGIVKLSERRATFVSAVTHELRTPLTTFNLYTEMLTEGLVPEKKMASYFATLRQEALRLTHLVDNVLSFSRLEKSRPGRHPECISLKNLKETVLKHISPRLENAEMTLETLLDAEDEQKEFCTDVTAVEQIMYNLADNAAKYAAVKGTAVILEILPRGRSLILRFRDCGPGIPESLRKKLFQPFSRSAEEAGGRKPGVGLGLALSREIARDLGGELKWDPRQGSGACFVLLLPWKTGKREE